MFANCLYLRRTLLLPSWRSLKLQLEASLRREQEAVQPISAARAIDDHRLVDKTMKELRELYLRNPGMKLASGDGQRARQLINSIATLPNVRRRLTIRMELIRMCAFIGIEVPHGLQGPK